MNLARMASATRKTTPTSGPSAGPPNTLAVPSSPKSSCHGRSAFVCGVRYPQVFGERWLTPFPETPTLSIRASESPLGDAPLNIPKQALVVVGDGEKALFLRNVGTVRKLELEVENVLAHGNPSTHEQGTDKPGRTSAGGHCAQRDGRERFASVGRRAVRQRDRSHTLSACPRQKVLAGTNRIDCRRALPRWAIATPREGDALHFGAGPDM